MKIAMTKRILFAIGCGVIGAGAQGCYREGCEADLTCLPLAPEITGGGSGSGGEGGTGSGGSGGRPVCPEDPSEMAGAPIADECGIWVRASLPGDDKNPGTQVAPVSTLTRAIALAQAGPKYVYACGEIYPEHIDLPAGVSLFGGFDCDQAWLYVGTSRRATVAPMVPGAFALTLLDGDERSFIGDITAQVVSAVEPGGSSIAVFATDHARADIRRSGIIAGNGADGADGEPGDHDNASAQQGLIGNAGAGACTMDPGLGGAEITLICEDGSSSKGGNGGNGNEAFANSGDNGQQPVPGNPQGAGGKGETAALGLNCVSGIGGAQGLDALDGVGAVGYGQLTLDGRYVGVPGGDGKHGAPGQGGGGGGASLGKAICGGAPHGGAGGGSGGTGGCGGRGGKGGQAGGSSIGIASRSTDILLSKVIITTGKGGRGGNGGKLQSGGQGGLPGLGGTGAGGGADPAKKGCAGGAGGYGGDGGNGGGGHGGHSLSSACVVKGHCPEGPEVVHNYGSAGKGGSGANPILHDGYGDDGNASHGVALEP